MSPIGHTDTEVGHYQTRYKLYWWPVERMFCWGWSRSYYLRKEQVGSEIFPMPVKKEPQHLGGLRILGQPGLIKRLCR